MTIQRANEPSTPILLSSPHSGYRFPEDSSLDIRPEFLRSPEDTDLLIDKLYGFAPPLGMTLVAAQYSRYLVDLNRPLDGGGLYQDGRKESGLVPTRTFSLRSLYPEGKEPSANEIKRRVEEYYLPYHRFLSEELRALRDRFGLGVLFDCHSIRRCVPSIRPEPFPDLIVGTADGSSADRKLADAVIKVLQSDGEYAVSVNDPFRGGHITRSLGNPSEGIHAIQLEMCQDLYLDTTKSAVEFDTAKKHRLQRLLKKALLALVSEAME